MEWKEIATPECISNVRFKIQNQAFGEKFSHLSHQEPRNMPGFYNLESR